MNPSFASVAFERFNTQPPEGGWVIDRPVVNIDRRFNTQPPEGGWGGIYNDKGTPYGFNTQPPEGGWLIIL